MDWEIMEKSKDYTFDVQTLSIQEIPHICLLCGGVLLGTP